MLLVLPAVLASLIAITGAATAAPGTQVSGEQAYNAGPDGMPCDPDTGAGCDDDYYDMTGSLVGAWITTSAECRVHAKTGQCSGTELFDGFLDANGNGIDDGAAEPDGTMTFTFTYSWSASGNGRCHHPITGGTGGFAGATGVITMKDRPTPTGLVTTYQGHVAL